MKLNFRLIAKLVLILVVIGFFMPIGSTIGFKQTGFEIAKSMVKSDKSVFYGLLLYLMVVSAAAGVAAGVMLLMKNKLKASVDWIIIGVCVVSMFIISQSSQFAWFKNLSKLQPGAYLILIGLIAALVFQILSMVKNEK